MSGLKVVAVNDEPVQLSQIAGVLEGGGYDVTAFESGADALEALARGLRADLFVLDLHMPVVDGWKMCRILRSSDFEAFNRTPIVVVSATYGGEQVAALTRELGANGFLEAPFAADDLLAMAAKVVQGEGAARPPVALIVEDDASVRELLARRFRHHGYSVVTEDSVLAARRAWLAARPDVALLDHHLPDGTSFDVMEDLATPHGRTAVLVMTGDTDPLLPVLLFDRGADGYLRKPFDPDHAVVHARSVAQQRALLRIGSTLETRYQEQQSKERRAHQSRRLESLGLLAGGIAHEFNNLLVGILGNADLAALDVPAGSPAHDSLEQVGSLARRAAERTRQILAYTGKARIHLESVELGRLVASVLVGMKDPLAGAVRLEGGSAPPSVVGDAERLTEVALSLITNGIEALPGGKGEVVVAVRSREIRPGEAVAVEGGGDLPPGRYAVLEVSDSGAGMDEVTRARMFDPFFSTKFTGRGLGLAAVLGIVRAHRGGIAVRTGAGTGTTVTVYLPAAPNA